MRRDGQASLERGQDTDLQLWWVAMSRQSLTSNKRPEQLSWSPSTDSCDCPSRSILMAHITSAPAFRAFNLALIQLGGITANKTNNLKHAHEMILKAANCEPKPNLIVLPVRKVCLVDNSFTIQVYSGMFQFTVWSYAFPCLRWADRVHSGPAIWSIQERLWEREDALRCSPRYWHLANWRYGIAMIASSNAEFTIRLYTWESSRWQAV